MSYWKTVGIAISICLALATLCQGLLWCRTIRMIESQQTIGLIVVHGWTKFLASVLLAGWITGSACYLLPANR